MERILVLVDNNVNARIVCEVLLESRGDACLRCGGEHWSDCCQSSETPGVFLLDVRLQDERTQAELQRTLEGIRRAGDIAIKVLVITEEATRLQQSGLSEFADRLLHPAQVGARLLEELDSLRRDEAGSPSVAHAFVPAEALAPSLRTTRVAASHR